MKELLQACQSGPAARAASSPEVSKKYVDETLGAVSLTTLSES